MVSSYWEDLKPLKEFNISITIIHIFLQKIYLHHDFFILHNHRLALPPNIQLMSDILGKYILSSKYIYLNDRTINSHKLYFVVRKINPQNQHRYSFPNNYNIFGFYMWFSHLILNRHVVWKVFISKMALRRYVSIYTLYLRI